MRHLLESAHQRKVVKMSRESLLGVSVWELRILNNPLWTLVYVPLFWGPPAGAAALLWWIFR